jgi:hypothetical protein
MVETKDSRGVRNYPSFYHSADSGVMEISYISKGKQLSGKI